MKKTLLSKAQLKPAPQEEEASTARELEPVEQIVRLSESSAPLGTPRDAASHSSPMRPVNTPPLLPPGAIILGTCTGWEEDEEHEVAGGQRRVKRYHRIAEIYAATEEIVPGSSGGRKKKMKKKE